MLKSKQLKNLTATDTAIHGRTVKGLHNLWCAGTQHRSVPPFCSGMAHAFFAAGQIFLTESFESSRWRTIQDLE